MLRSAARLCHRLALLLTLAPAASAGAETLPLAPDIRDPVFAMLVAYVRGDRLGLVTREAIERTLDRGRRRSRLPWQQARDFARAPLADDHGAAVTLRFAEPVDVRIPYRILWYHPGRIRASPVCRFREWRLEALAFEAPQADKTRIPATLADVRLFALEEGELLVDIDGWLDALLGGALDDTEIACLALGRYRSREYGFAVGRNRQGGSRLGVFDLSQDSVVFPLPADLRAANRAVRREHERRLASPR